MSDLRDAANREAVLKTLLDAIKTEYDAARAEVQQHLDEAREITRLDAALPDGTVVAKVILTDPKPAATVTDEQAFLAWVRENRPDQVHSRLVVEVRPAFQTALLNELTAAKTTQWCDEDGVVHTVPGVQIRATRARTHSVRFEDDGKADVAAAWRAGQLNEVVTLALPASE